MEKIISVILVLVIAGCSTHQTLEVPVLYCPAPIIPERPNLAISNMNDEQLSHHGELANHYRATVRQLLGYSQELEMELQKYQDTNTEYEKFKDTMNQEEVDRLSAESGVPVINTQVETQ